MRLIDLSWDIEQGMPVYPSDDSPVLEQDKYIQKDEYNNYKLTAGTHIGTHVDSPMHLTESSRYIGEYELDKFCGKACVIDVSGKDTIIYEPYIDKLIDNKKIILLYTGYDSIYGTYNYYNCHPVLDITFMEFMVRKNIKLIGFDMPSPDRYPYEIHKSLLSNGIFIVENLRNLSLLIKENEIEFYALPLKLKADASWVRAVAKTN